jgi:hypothetical protein
MLGLEERIDRWRHRDPSGDEAEVLMALYDRQDLTVDRLPYTTEFEALYGTFKALTCSDATRGHVFWWLLEMRKTSKKDEESGEKRLATKGRGRQTRTPTFVY